MSSSSIATSLLDTSNSANELAVANRKLAAAELRRARKAANFNPRARLLSDSSDETRPKGILKNARIPTKRSVSECVDDLSLIMADLDLNIHDLPKNTGKFCLHYQNFREEDEQQEDDEDEDEDEDDEDDRDQDDDEHDVSNSENKIKNHNKSTKCDCNFYGDNNSNQDDGQEKPKKSVRFDEKVYETFFFASRLYDRKLMPKFHFSTRHHPQHNKSQNKSHNKKGRQRSKSESDGDSHNGSSSFASLKSDNSCKGCKLSKSQRAKQSKKDKKKRLNNNNGKKDDVTDTSSDDQGYHSHSFSD